MSRPRFNRDKRDNWAVEDLTAHLTWSDVVSCQDKRNIF